MAKLQGQLNGLRRGIHVLNILGREQKALTFGRVQEEMDGLPAATLSRLLKVLADEDLIIKEPDEGGYRTGPALDRLARTVLGRVQVGDLLQPVLDALGRRTNESAAYYELIGTDITCRAKVERPEAFHYMQINGLNSRIFRNGFGQIAIAYLNQKQYADLVCLSDDTPVISKTAFSKRLADIREQGYLFENGEASDRVMRIIAPVKSGERFFGTIGITMFKQKIAKSELKRLTDAVLQAAKQASCICSPYSLG